ncbi:MAG: hypothetical protein R2741_08510 [Methanolobus sp.]
MAPLQKKPRRLLTTQHDPLIKAGFFRPSSPGYEKNSEVKKDVKFYTTAWGRDLYLQMKAISPEKNEKGIVTGCFGTIEDISKRKIAEKTLLDQAY